MVPHGIYYAATLSLIAAYAISLFRLLFHVIRFRLFADIFRFSLRAILLAPHSPDDVASRYCSPLLQPRCRRAFVIVYPCYAP